jgi:hypothetical protein
LQGTIASRLTCTIVIPSIGANGAIAHPEMMQVQIDNEKRDTIFIGVAQFSSLEVGKLMVLTFKMIKCDYME